MRLILLILNLPFTLTGIVPMILSGSYHFYLYELITKGYRQNKFEDEAYKLSNSVYEGGK